MRDYNQDPIVVYFPGSYAHMKKFYRFHSRNRKGFYILLLAFLIVVLALTIPQGGLSRLPRFNIMVYAIIIADTLYRLLIAQCVFYTPKVYQKYWNHYRGGRLYHFMEDHYTSVAQDGSYQLTMQSPYDDVVKILETNDTLYLYTTPAHAHILPKDGIQHDSATLEELIKLIRRKWPAIPYNNISGEKRDPPTNRAI